MEFMQRISTSNISQTDTTMVDFVLKADVDTYIIWENALTFLRRFDSALPHYIGRELVDPRDGALVAARDNSQ